MDFAVVLPWVPWTITAGEGGVGGGVGCRQPVQREGKVCLSLLTRSPGTGQLKLEGGCLNLCLAVSSCSVPLGGQGSKLVSADHPAAEGGGRGGGEDKRIPGAMQTQSE